VHLPEQWTEAEQLCASKPFELFCASPLPTADQRVICRACGHPVDFLESGHLARAGCAGHHVHHGEQLQVMTEPEAMHEAMGGEPWTAPYVWETNYLEED